MAEQRQTAGDDYVVDKTDTKTEARSAKRLDREIKEVRAGDIEPYTGLGYLSKLFKFMAVILVMLLIAEIATGIYTQGSAAVPTLLGEASRLIVLAGVLWGTGDLANLLIDIGHDVRASRIMVSRVTHSRSAAPTSGSRTVIQRTEVPFSDRPVQRGDMSSPRDLDDTPPTP
ncbi:MAG TPA: hypothetical protein VIP11_13285 [Gemmatimonadaceae bacterium]